jgi:hypothetical protein
MKHDWYTEVLSFFCWNYGKLSEEQTNYIGYASLSLFSSLLSSLSWQKFCV